LSSSTEPGTDRVLRGTTATSIAATALPTPELRDGAWTRFGAGAVLGDVVTEQALAGLAESTRHAARAQGYAVGWAEGRRAAAAAAAVEAEEARTAVALAEQQREAELRDHLAALTAAAGDFHRASRVLAADVEDQALRLARELTELLVGHELRSSDDPAGDVVRRVLAVLPSGVATTVRLHPATAACVASDALSQQVTLAADDTLARHDAVVETADRVVDLSIEAALRRVREALS
jgi:flagellar assembly protein FliH